MAMKELQELLAYFKANGKVAKLDEIGNYYEECDGPCVVMEGWITTHGFDGYTTDRVVGNKHFLERAHSPKEVFDFITSH